MRVSDGGRRGVDVPATVLILGHGGHGKDEAARMLGLPHMSSSWAAAEAIYPQLQAALGHPYKSVAEAHADRRRQRDLWADLISAYNNPDKSRLARYLLSQVPVYVGMRRPDEYEAARHLFDHVIWVDASQRLPPEPSMWIEETPDMLHVDNNGSKAALRARMLGIKRSLDLR